MKEVLSYSIVMLIEHYDIVDLLLKFILGGICLCTIGKAVFTSTLLCAEAEQGVDYIDAEYEVLQDATGKAQSKERVET